MLSNQLRVSSRVHLLNSVEVCRKQRVYLPCICILQRDNSGCLWFWQHYCYFDIFVKLPQSFWYVQFKFESQMDRSDLMRSILPKQAMSPHLSDKVQCSVSKYTKNCCGFHGTQTFRLHFSQQQAVVFQWKRSDKSTVLYLLSTRHLKGKVSNWLVKKVKHLAAKESDIS